MSYHSVKHTVLTVIVFYGLGSVLEDCRRDSVNIVNPFTQNID
jgi:hypothetical protein